MSGDVRSISEHQTSCKNKAAGFGLRSAGLDSSAPHFYKTMAAKTKGGGNGCGLLSLFKDKLNDGQHVGSLLEPCLNGSAGQQVKHMDMGTCPARRSLRGDNCTQKPVPSAQILFPLDFLL